MQSIREALAAITDAPWVLVLLSVLAVAALVSLLVTLLSDRAIRRSLARRPGAPPSPWPGVSVFKPVKGADDGLYENLSSMARQDYPGPFEILVGAADARDPALAVARRVAHAHPEVQMRLLVCPEDGGLNPKVSTLRALSNYAAHDLTLISDSNVRVGPDYLQAIVSELGDPSVGLVTNPVVGSGEVDTGATFESLHLLTYVARALCFAAAYVDRACVVGKSMLFRRSDLVRLGGWSLVRDVLAEDYLIGQAFQQAGLRVVSSPHVIFTHGRRWPLARFANRHLRWGQMRRRICLPAYALEPLFNSHALLLVLAALALTSDQAEAVAWPIVLPFVGAAMGVRLLADRALWRRMRGSPPTLHTLFLTIPKDLLVFALWAVAAVRRTIDWRGHVMYIGRGTRLERRPTRATAMEEVA